jgi:acyl-CoA thioester hydrolase
MILHPPATGPDGAHLYRCRVYYEDTDAGGVVYHANYLRFAERARTEALRDLGVPHAEMTASAGLIFMVRRVKVDYLAPARVDDSLAVVTRPLDVRAASVDLGQTIVRAADDTDVPSFGRELAVLHVQLACVRLTDGRPARLPPRWRAALAGLVQSKG